MPWQRLVAWLVVAVVTTVALDASDVPDPWPFVVFLVVVAAYGADMFRSRRRS